MTIPEYLDKVNTRYKAEISTEHSYRGDLQSLLETIAPDVLVTNEPTRIACGAPDYIVTKRKIPVGYYIEAKYLGADLTTKSLLSFEDILHYQKIIVALTETARVMGEIDKLIFKKKLIC